jgi:hypothetical protein
VDLLRTEAVEVPIELQEYCCLDYFQSELSEYGHWDDGAELWLILPAGQIEVQPTLEFLAVGRPGVDGITFGYRKGHKGFWAYHPFDEEYQFLAPSIQEFVREWETGGISI